MIKSKLKINSLLSLALFSVAFLFFMRIGSFFYNLRGMRVSILLTFVWGLYFIVSKPITKELWRNSQWIMFSIFMLSIYLIFNIGDSTKTLQLISAYSFPYSLFVIAYYAGQKSKFVSLNLWFKVLFIVTSMTLLPYVYFGVGESQVSKQFANEFYESENSLIVIWPFIFIMATFSFILTYFETNRFQIIYIILYLIVLASIIISGFTASFLMVLITISMYFILVKSDKKYFRMMFYGVITIIILYMIFSFIGSGAIGDLGGSSKKISAFLQVFSSDNTYRNVLLNQATSGRWEIYMISINNFLDSPIYGHGFSWGSWIGSTPISSQHSSILDNFAYFGIFSFFILMIYIGFAINAYKLFSTSKNNNEIRIYALIFSLLIAFLIANFFNPYFNFWVINEIIFFIGGWMAGIIDSKSNTRFLRYSRLTFS